MVLWTYKAGFLVTWKTNGSFPSTRDLWKLLINPSEEALLHGASLFRPLHTINAVLNLCSFSIFIACSPSTEERNLTKWPGWWPMDASSALLQKTREYSRKQTLRPWCEFSQLLALSRSLRILTRLMHPRILRHLQNIQFSSLHRLPHAAQPRDLRELLVHSSQEALHHGVVVVDELRWGETVDVVTRKPA